MNYSVYTGAILATTIHIQNETQMTNLSTITFEEWISQGGCGLSGWSRYYVGEKLDLPEIEWRKLPLMTVVNSWVVAAREVEYYAKNHLGINEFPWIETAAE